MASAHDYETLDASVRRYRRLLLGCATKDWHERRLQFIRRQATRVIRTPAAPMTAGRAGDWGDGAVGGGTGTSTNTPDSGSGGGSNTGSDSGSMTPSGSSDSGGLDGGAYAFPPTCPAAPSGAPANAVKAWQLLIRRASLPAPGA